CRMTVLPARGRYCFGLSAAMRVPPPAAGMIAQHASLGACGLRVRSVIGSGKESALYGLEEGFVATDHAQFTAGPLFDRRGALLQIDDLGVQRFIAFAQGFVLDA